MKVFFQWFYSLGIPVHKGNDEDHQPGTRLPDRFPVFLPGLSVTIAVTIEFQVR